MLQAKAKSEHAVDDFCALHGELRHDAVLMFDLNRKIVMRQNIARHAKDGGQLACIQTVIHIVMHPGLQQTGFQRAPGAAAVDEAFHDMAHFGDVIVSGDEAAIWHDKQQGLVCISTEMIEEFGDDHGVSSRIWF